MKSINQQTKQINREDGIEGTASKGDIEKMVSRRWHREDGRRRLQGVSRLTIDDWRLTIDDLRFTIDDWRLTRWYWGTIYDWREVTSRSVELSVGSRRILMSAHLWCWSVFDVSASPTSTHLWRQHIFDVCAIFDVCVSLTSAHLWRQCIFCVGASSASAHFWRQRIFFFVSASLTSIRLWCRRTVYVSASSMSAPAFAFECICHWDK